MHEDAERILDNYLPEDLKQAFSERTCFAQTLPRFNTPEHAAGDFVRQHHGDSYYAFLTGSHASGTATPQSDVDIYVIYEERPQAVRKQILFRSYPLQVGIMSEGYLRAIIDRDRRSGSLSFLPAFAASIHLEGSVEAFKSLRHEAVRVLGDGPPLATPARIARARAAVINNLLKLFRGMDEVERFGACVKLIRNVGKYIQLCDQAWIMNEVRYEAVLRESHEYAAAIEAVPQALTGNVEPLIHVVYGILQSRGAVNWGILEHDDMPFFN